MDITGVNFKESLALVLKSIRTADFIAYDTEFSGLFVGNEDRPHDYETLESRYQKLRHACRRMHAFQFGFCTFKWDSKANKYYMRPFNFYVWPSAQSMLDHSIHQFEPGAVQFLCSNKFDFNKLFRQGLGYCKISDKSTLLKRIATKFGEVPVCLR